MSDMTTQNAIYCMKAMLCEEVCEDCDYYGKTGTDHCEADAVRMAIKALELSGRKRGEWIPHEDEDGEHYGDKCSECGEWYVMPYGKTNFCPNCGADMRGEHDE